MQVFCFVLFFYSGRCDTKIQGLKKAHFFARKSQIFAAFLKFYFIRKFNSVCRSDSPVCMASSSKRKNICNIENAFFLYIYISLLFKKHPLNVSPIGDFFILCTS